jgi:hypothetical protein
MVTISPRTNPLLAKFRCTEETRGKPIKTPQSPCTAGLMKLDSGIECMKNRVLFCWAFTGLHNSEIISAIRVPAGVMKWKGIDMQAGMEGQVFSSI